MEEIARSHVSFRLAAKVQQTECLVGDAKLLNSCVFLILELQEIRRRVCKVFMFQSFVRGFAFQLC